MPLSAEQVYDELNGAEVKEILLARFKELLDSVHDFQRHLTLPRVHMKLQVHLDIYGRRNPAIDIVNDLLLRVKDTGSPVDIVQSLEAEEVISADTGAAVADSVFDGLGDPPDQVRAENGLMLLEPVKDRTTQAYAQRPTPPPAPPVDPVAAASPPIQPGRPPGGRRYAAFRVLEREGPAVMGFTDYVQGAEPFTKSPQAIGGESQTGVTGGERAPVQKDFRDSRLQPEKKE